MEKEIMRTNNMNPEALETFTTRFALGFASPIFLMMLLLGLLLVAGLVDSSAAQNAQPRTFASPGEAGDALFQAVQNQNQQALESILGAGKEVTSSSDEEEDKLEREQFSQKYQQMHRFVREPDGITVLYIGAENWPFPIPLVSKNGKWSFDPARGKQEILFRRVGENEITAIDVCEEFALAKTARAAKADSSDPITEFAHSLASGGAANADSKESTPFHGYYFRIVTNNSEPEKSSADKKGSLTLVAYPAQYKSSGVKTFVVTGDGLVYERDLGPGTTKLAPEIKGASGSSWHPAA
jgi:Protein of unknown function (DUF2950)